MAGMRNHKRRVRYVTPRFKETGQADYFDPAELGFPSHEEAPFQFFSHSHNVMLTRRERVGTLFAFGNSSFDLRTESRRHVICVENSVTGEHLFIPRQNILMFFWNVLESLHLVQTWNTAEVQEPGSAARALESRKSKSAYHDTDQEFRKRGGNPQFQSEFKGKYGLRRDMRSGTVIKG